MKSQILNLIIRKAANKHVALSLGLSIAVANAIITLPVTAQSSNEDSYLPPEVIPTSQSINYGTASNSAKSISSLLPGNNSSASNAPGIVSQITQQQNFQTPQEARQALYDSWAGNKIFSQANGQSSYNETSNPMNNLTNQSISNQNMPNGQIQNLGQSMPQNLNSQMNATNNPSAPQTQVLSGNVNTQSTSQQRTSGGISHATGLLGGLAMGAFCLAGMRSTGGIYSGGLLGAGTANYAVNNGFRF